MRANGVRRVESGPAGALRRPELHPAAARDVRFLVRRLLLERGMTQKELAERIGMSPAVLSHFLTGRRRKLTEEESRAIERELDLPGLLDIGGAREAGLVTLPRRLRLIPVFPVGAGYEIAFGDGDTPVGESLEDPIPADVPDPNAFAGRIVGSSMEAPDGADASFREGDVVVFDTKAEVRDGSFCLVRFRDDGSTFKQVFRTEDRVRLHPLNPDFPDEVHPLSEIRAMYRAVKHIRNL